MLLPVLFFRSSNADGLLFWCVIGMCAGLGCFFYGFRLLQRRRLILDTPFSKIRSAALGMVEVSGLAVGPYTMVAPITARLCYYYRTIVWEWKQQGKNKQWVKVAGDSRHVPFFLDDNTGRVLIDPRGADLDIHRDFQQEFCDSFFTAKDPAPENVRSFLAAHGIVTSNKIKVEEFCIKPKNSLFILGTLAENPGLEVTAQPIRDSDEPASIASFAMPLLNPVSFSTRWFGGESDGMLLAPPLTGAQDAQCEISQPCITQICADAGPTKSGDMSQQQKIAAALVKAGISNPAAWSAAGLGAPEVKVVQETHISDSAENGNKSSDSGAANGHTSGFESHPAVVLMKGANDKAFLISWRSQREVARSLGWKCALMIWGGPALALLGLYCLLNSRGLL